MWNRRFDRHPGLIARCRAASDVVRAVQFVRSENLLVSVRSGGHSFGGHSVCDGGVVIDLSAMKRLQVKARERVVVMGPGVLLGEVEEAAQARGLATITGQCRAHPVSDVLAGSLIYAPGDGRAALDVYRDVMAEAPDELFVAARFVAVPPDPPVFMFHVLWAGDPGAGEAAVRPLRTYGKPLADTLAPMGYLAAQRLEPSSPPGPNAARTGFFPSLSDEILDAFSEACGKGPPDHLAQLVPLNGASSRVPPSETAFPLRDAGYALLLISGWERPAQARAAMDWVHGGWQTLRPYSRGAYVNLLEDEGPERVGEAYGGNYARLAALKAVYDPENMFRSNQNIAPAL
jgi:hypothetical protein